MAAPMTPKMYRLFDDSMLPSEGVLAELPGLCVCSGFDFAGWA